ncbi:MAG: ATP-binding protein, partial [Cyanobacteria bacterium J06649_11]
MVQVFGDFVESTQKKENLTLGFSPSSVPINERWRNNGLSANYVAEYLATVLNTDENESND